ncbi:hypothetical protein SAMN05216499_10788 [Actinacidiphila paucisporea]|uniref:Uncharacterized protein n=1 Tax=Actinacidiphila paucisporea TaxID=310782 RepID=A0A1M7EUN7_9ACTN|nr:hypothetical protein SAMN05216499_10788 [Actinacidiphila paucisporea]
MAVAVDCRPTLPDTAAPAAGAAASRVAGSLNWT